MTTSGPTAADALGAGRAALQRVSLANGGPGLGTMWGEQQALEILTGAGFEDVEVERVPADFINSYYVARKR